jgi:hypothetical protein
VIAAQLLSLTTPPALPLALLATTPPALRQAHLPALLVKLSAARHPALRLSSTVMLQPPRLVMWQVTVLLLLLREERPQQMVQLVAMLLVMLLAPALHLDVAVGEQGCSALSWPCYTCTGLLEPHLVQLGVAKLAMYVLHGL